MEYGLTTLISNRTETRPILQASKKLITPKKLVTLEKTFTTTRPTQRILAANTI